MIVNQYLVIKNNTLLFLQNKNIIPYAQKPIFISMNNHTRNHSKSNPSPNHHPQNQLHKSFSHHTANTMAITVPTTTRAKKTSSTIHPPQTSPSTSFHHLPFLMRKHVLCYIKKGSMKTTYLAAQPINELFL